MPIGKKEGLLITKSFKSAFKARKVPGANSSMYQVEFTMVQYGVCFTKLSCQVGSNRHRIPEGWRCAGIYNTTVTTLFLPGWTAYLTPNSELSLCSKPHASVKRTKIKQPLPSDMQIFLRHMPRPKQRFIQKHHLLFRGQRHSMEILQLRSLSWAFSLSSKTKQKTCWRVSDLPTKHQKTKETELIRPIL